ncbi:MAG: YfhO family protein [Verrucomicrobiota bacterium]
MPGMSGQETHVAAHAPPFKRWAGPTLTPLTFGLFLALLLLAMFPQVWSGSESFFFRDFGIFGYPLAHYHREAFWRGEVPLWNPLNNCGLPFLAQWNTLTLYPLSLIYLLFPLPWSLNVFCLLHLVLAGTGMFVLVSRWTAGNRLAAALAGTVFALNGLALNCLMWPNNVAALGWMPWVILSTQSAWRFGGRKIAIAALVGAISMLAGAPEIIVFTWMIAGLLLTLDLWRTRKQLRVMSRLLARFATAFAFVLLLAAAQLLPFADLALHSNRGQNFENNTWPMPSWGWLNLLTPLFGCYRSPLGVFFQPNQDWASSYYVGALCLVLALGAWYWRRERRVMLFVLLSLFGLVMALGYHGGLYKLLADTLPLLKFMRFPIKFVVLPVFCLPVLAGLAVAALARPSRMATAPKLVWTGMILAGLLIGITTMLGLRFEYASAAALFYNGGCRIMLGAGLTVLLLANIRTSSSPSQWMQYGFIALLALDLLTHVPPQNPTVPVAACQPNQIAVDSQSGFGRALMTKPTHDRLYGSMLTNAVADYTGRRLGLFGNCNLLDGTPTPDGFYSLYLPGPRSLWELTFFAPSNRIPERLADFMGIQQVSSTRQFLAWEPRTNALPLITGGQAPWFVPKWEADWTDLPMDPRAGVLLSQRYANTLRATNRVTIAIRKVSIQAHAIRFETDAPQAGLVVLAQSYYHPWRAFVDQQETPILKANLAFQALEVPAGKHAIELVYRDWWFRIGALLSGVTLVGLLGWLLRSSRPSPPRGRRCPQGG